MPSSNSESHCCRRRRGRRLQNDLADLRRAANEIAATLAQHPSDPLLQDLLDVHLSERTAVVRQRERDDGPKSEDRSMKWFVGAALIVGACSRLRRQRLAPRDDRETCARRRPRRGRNRQRGRRRAGHRLGPRGSGGQRRVGLGRRAARLLERRRAHGHRGRVAERSVEQRLERSDRPRAARQLPQHQHGQRGADDRRRPRRTTPASRERVDHD